MQDGVQRAGDGSAPEVADEEDVAASVVPVEDPAGAIS